MKQIKRQVLRLIAIAVVIAMVCGLLPVVAEERKVTPPCYGQQVLAGEANARNLLFVYEQLVAGLSAAEEEIAVEDATHSITSDELQVVFTAVISDHPELFWFSGGYSYRWDGTYVYSVIPQYSMTGSNLEAAKKAVEKQVLALTTGLQGKSEYEIALELHDRLATHVSYEFAGYHQTIYGALVGGKAVCNGYAAAYQYLLQRMGIQAWKVTGSSVDPSTGKLVSHAWDMVCLDGNWYHTDPTWDDQDGTEVAFYGYLDVTTEQISEDHVMDDFFDRYAPVCTATAANYYAVNSSGSLNKFDVNAVTAAMKASDSSVIRFYVPEDINTFLKEFTNNVVTIATNIGVTGGFSYGYYSLGHEVVLRIITQQTVSGTIDFCDKDDAITVELWKWGASSATYSTTLVNSNRYQLENVRSGDYILHVKKAGNVQYTCPVTVGTHGVLQDVALTLIGDVLEDGTVDAQDALYTLYHTLLPDEYPVSQLVDYTDDGEISSDDAVYLLYYTLIPDEYPLG
ncbi:MAG: hypothetical protein IJ518_03660 [Clostridia bacterium]|nr:hypothetical protein [Clostridia bacterium]